MDNSLMGYVGAFIAVAIMLGIGTLILGGAATDCTTIIGYSVGEVSSVAVNTGGNYTSDPTVAFSGGGGSLAAADLTTGTITGGVEVLTITVTEGGQDYSSAPTVSFDGGAPVDTQATATATISSPTTQTGWAGQCETNNTQSQAGYNLLIIVLIVLAAVVVLTVVRMLA